MKPIRRVLAEPGNALRAAGRSGLLGLASAAATIGLLAGSGYVVGRAAFRPGLGALVGVLAAVEVLAFLRGPLRYAERLVGHDATLRALARWRVWLYDCLTPRVPAALAGWRSGDLLTRTIDDVDTLSDLYLRTLLPLAVALGSSVLGLVVVGVILPVGAIALGVPLAIACTVPPFLAWTGRGGDEAADPERRALGPGRGRHSRSARPAGLRGRRRHARPHRDAQRAGRGARPAAGPGQRRRHPAHPAVPGRGARGRAGRGGERRARPPPRTRSWWPCCPWPRSARSSRFPASPRRPPVPGRSARRPAG